MLPDASTQHRREYKFVYPGVMLQDLADLLSVNARATKFGEHDESHVRSIYFDDIRLSSCWQSLDGIDPRNKVRLRWYDREWPLEHAVFELKQKRGYYIDKTRSAVRLGADLQGQSYSWLTDKLRALLPPGQMAWLDLWPEPTMLVSYRRQHFVDPEYASSDQKSIQ